MILIQFILWLQVSLFIYKYNNFILEEYEELRIKQENFKKNLISDEKLEGRDFNLKDVYEGLT